ncbi:transcription termination/antitermination NusG family protein [Yersinia enterocolitica]|uniref:transcription termination/antitermination NusG family protein n=1 Tax=Yersinia enterocolitica TaxID=630 RepID=UPI002A0E2025|nr:transcriptional activator [Yersinia enterocolitica]EKN6091037.1 transcriptional activator [Yersinia enterocolitica]ELY5242000.1 transcriptional activator [Yersinia enterocolitica]
MKSWYLLSYKYGQVKRVQFGLDRLGVNSFSPSIQVKKVRSDSRTIRLVNEPMFPTYLFVEFDIESIHTTTISSTLGVNDFVKFGTEPKPIPLSLIHQLMNRSECSNQRNEEIDEIDEIATIPDKKLRCALFIKLITQIPDSYEQSSLIKTHHLPATQQTLSS